MNIYEFLEAEKRKNKAYWKMKISEVMWMAVDSEDEKIKDEVKTLLDVVIEDFYKWAMNLDNWSKDAIDAFSGAIQETLIMSSGSDEHLDLEMLDISETSCVHSFFDAEAVENKMARAFSSPEYSAFKTLTGYEIVMTLSPSHPKRLEIWFKTNRSLMYGWKKQKVDEAEGDRRQTIASAAIEEYFSPMGKVTTTYDGKFDVQFFTNNWNS